MHEKKNTPSLASLTFIFLGDMKKFTIGAHFCQPLLIREGDGKSQSVSCPPSEKSLAEALPYWHGGRSWSWIFYIIEMPYIS